MVCYNETRGCIERLVLETSNFLTSHPIIIEKIKAIPACAKSMVSRCVG